MTKVHLEALHRPLIFGNMTREELVREAEHTFPNPSPIIAAMLTHLRGQHDGKNGDAVGMFPARTVHHEEHQCPACGASVSAKVIA